MHLYNATAPIFRRVVFRIDREECEALAVEGTRHVMKYAEALLAGGAQSTDFGYEYSPEIFMDTELDFALDVCSGVMDVWQPRPARKSSSTCRARSSGPPLTSTPTRSSG